MITALILFILETDKGELNLFAFLIAVTVMVTGVVTAYFIYKANSEKKEVERLTRKLSEAEEKNKSLKTDLSFAKQEIDLDSYALSFSDFLQMWSEVATKLQTIFNSTKTTRFLILRAWNGYEAPRYTTSMIQYRDGQFISPTYIHFELDDDYVEKLLTTRRKRILRVDVKNEGETAIGGVYRSEKPPVKFANWYFIKDEKIDENRVIVTYCSFATDKDTEFSESEEVAHKLLVNLIQSKMDEKDIHQTIG